MPLRRDCASALRLCALACLLATAGGKAAAALPVAAGQPPTVEQVDEALVALQADPNLPHEQTVRRLAWKPAGQPDPPDGTAAWLEWFGAFFAWLATSARLLMWVTIGILAAMLAVFLYRLLRSERMPELAIPEALPTHVRDLDIRQESLPDDVAGTARALWDAGEQRRALALLYRALLSQLVHRYHAPVRESTTEGESLALARACLPQAGAHFAQSLVSIWQRAVYGGQMPVQQQVHALCDEFTAALQAPP